MKFLSVLLVLTFPFFGFSQKLFDKIERKDAQFVKQYLKKNPDPKELVASRKGEMNDSLVSFTVSAIEWCAIMDCQGCLEEFMANKEKLSSINLKEELNKCVPHTGRTGNVQMLEYLIQQGADIYTKCNSCYDQNVIELSLTYCKYDLFYKLIEKGFPVNSINSSGRNLLHILFSTYNDPDFNNKLNIDNRKGSVDTLKNIAVLLKSKGVDVNLQDKDKCTPLHNVALTNQPDLFKWIRNNGAKIDLANKKDVATLLNNGMYYRTAVDAETVDNKMFFLILALEKIKLDKIQIETLDNYGNYMLSASIYNYNPEAFIKLITFNPDVNLKDGNGNTPIEYAIDAEDYYAIDKLLEAGAKVTEDDLKDAKRIFKKKSDVIKKLEAALN